MGEICASGSVGGEGGNTLAYPARCQGGLRPWRLSGARLAGVAPPRQSPRDIVDMLKETLPRKPEGKDALVRRINERHQRRLGAIQSRFRAAAKSQPP